MRYLFISFLSLITVAIQAQSTGLFNSLLNTSTGWQVGSGYSVTGTSSGLKVSASSVGSSYQSFQYIFSTMDLSQAPYVQINVSSASSFKLRIDLKDNAGNVTNTTPINTIVSGNSQYATYTFDFTGKFSQTYPTSATVDPTQISGLVVYFNPGGYSGYSGTVYFDSLRIGDSCKITPPPALIKLNQIGFYPNHQKLAVSAETSDSVFYLVSSNKVDTVFTGSLASAVLWDKSGEKVQLADFTAFDSTGGFYLTTDSLYSFPFQIAPQIHNSVTKGLLKSYYFNRASMPIQTPWADQWPRAAGLPDNKVYIDTSSATADRAIGTIISSPGGWFDAGDYDKYMVNAGITTYQILALYEHFPSYFDTLNTNIPESGNSIPDILDEALYEIRWMLTCQDPGDGSVYFKITDAHFDGFEMPDMDNQKRYAIGRSTTSAADFAAITAMASRIFKKFDTELPQFSDTLLHASIRAYEWAKNNANIYFTNPSFVSTGSYSDTHTADELTWARLELYVTTRMDSLYKPNDINFNFSVPSWSYVNTLGAISFINNREALNTNGYQDTSLAINNLITLANSLTSYAQTCPYRVSMGHASYDFSWGSNAIAGNQGFILLEAFRATGDSTYLNAAISLADYILGRNGTNYSFITDFGSHSPMDPHHRISYADGVVPPIPGMVVGGPNPQQNDNCPGYTSSYPASVYLDSHCSYSTNEPAINYTSAVTYLIGGIEGTLAGASWIAPYSTPPVASIVAPRNSTASFKINAYPNPVSDAFTANFKIEGTAQIELIDASGRLVRQETVVGSGMTSYKIEASDLPTGMYFLSVTTNESSGVVKIFKR